jgi:alkanesulfonate monooxygenase SsuD/methylene tetrahydromethanopterin reductase-like flavin-dependent oxidoreductase (luciferase family)
MRRVALHADGWNPAGLPVEKMHSMFRSLCKMAERGGRDPQHLELVVRANLWFSRRPLQNGRPAFAGDRSQVADDIAATREIGAHELFFEAGGLREAQSVDGLLEALQQLREMARGS